MSADPHLGPLPTLEVSVPREVSVAQPAEMMGLPTLTDTWTLHRKKVPMRARPHMHARTRAHPRQDFDLKCRNVGKCRSAFNCEGLRETPSVGRPTLRLASSVGL